MGGTNVYGIRFKHIPKYKLLILSDLFFRTHSKSSPWRFVPPNPVGGLRHRGGSPTRVVGGYRPNPMGGLPRWARRSPRGGEPKIVKTQLPPAAYPKNRPPSSELEAVLSFLVNTTSWWVFTIWRREGDSNPRYPFGVYALSRRASSTTPASLRG